MNELLTCPNCGSDQVTAAHIQKFMVNTGEHWCHSVKTHDGDSPSGCLDCNWEGERDQLVRTEKPKKTKKK
jgi:hypothetical protein